jgi:DDE_Tnp_1-associated/Transposase DDE domain
VSVCQELSSLSIATDDEQEWDISSLVEMLETVPDPRSTRGRIYRLSFILAVSLVAVLAGAANFRQIRDQVADMPQSLLRKLGGRWCYFRCLFGWPSERTIRRVLEGIDAAALDQTVGGWLLTRARRGEDGVLAVAIDGKVLAGAWTDAHDQFTLFSAMVQQTGVTVAQVQVPAGTTETTQVRHLLDEVSTGDGDQVVITADAAHTQRATAEYIKGERGCDYILTVKLFGNSF